MMMFFVIYTSLCSQIFKGYVCDDFDGGVVSVLRADYSISCHSPEYKSFLNYLYLMTFLYPFGVPIVFFYLARKHSHVIGVEDTIDLANGKKKDLRVENFKVKHIKFLFKQYKAEYWWWESLECMRKVTITGFMTIIFQGKASQLCFGCGFVLFFLMCYAYFQPYRTPSDNFNMLVGQVVCLALMFCQLMMKVNIPGDDGYDPRSFTIVRLILILCPILLAFWTITKEFHNVKKEGSRLGTQLIKKTGIGRTGLNEMVSGDRGGLTPGAKIAPMEGESEGADSSSLPETTANKEVLDKNNEQ